MSFKLIVLLAGVFYLPISSDDGSIKLYEYTDMVNKFDAPEPYKISDLRNEDLKSRIRFIHESWDKVSKPTNN